MNRLIGGNSFLPIFLLIRLNKQNPEEFFNGEKSDVNLTVGLALRVADCEVTVHRISERSLSNSSNDLPVVVG